MRLAVLLTVVIICASCSSDVAQQRPEQPAAKPAEVPEPVEAQTQTQVEMVNVKIHLDPRLILHIRHLSGKLLPTKKGQTPSFDDKLSYLISIDSAEIAVDTASMTHMMNTYVFGEPDAPLKNLHLSTQGNQIKQTGTLKKGIGIPFEMVGEMSPTPDGKVRIHATDVKAVKLPVKGLLKIFRLDMANLINTKNTKGITADENDIILDPAQALPPPKMRGRITAIRIEGDKIVQIFGPARSAPPKTTPASNYMAYRGGVLRFGRLTMNDTDMRLVDADPTNAFDFSPDRYKGHLVAGYSKTTPSGGLLVYMPDLSKISKSLAPR
jgi:hypothetical protein